MVQPEAPAGVEHGPAVPAGEVFSIVHMTTIVVPILIEPHMQFMTYWACIASNLGLVHNIVALLGVGPYKEDRRRGRPKGQWIGG